MRRGAEARRANWMMLACAVALLLAVPVIATVSPAPTRAAMILPAGPPTSAPPDLLRPVPLAAPGSEDPHARETPAPRSGLARAAVAAAAAAAAASTDLAVAVLDRATGEVAAGEGGAKPFYTASLSKVVVAVDMLDRRRLEGLAVTESDIDLIRRALGPSDDAAMNVLWTRFDGQGAAGRVSVRLGLTNTSDPARTGQWGEMSVPAVDMVRLWEHMLDEMPAADRDVLLAAMGAAPPTARDGFEQSYGLLAPELSGPDGPGAVAKQGWMCCFSGRYYLNSAGAVGSDQRFLVALLSRQPRGEGWAGARQELDRIAAATVQALG